MTAIVASSAPGANVVPIRMARRCESTDWDALHALARATQIGAHVVTLAYRQVLGTADSTCQACGTIRRAARSEVFEKLLDWASDQGQRAIVAAAGNDSSGTVARPAKYPRAIPVTALNSSGTALATFSNYDAAGTLPVLALPGEDVATGNSGTATEGTSFATGYAAALYAVAMGRGSTTDASTVTTTLTGAGHSVPHATVPVLI